MEGRTRGNVRTRRSDAESGSFAPRRAEKSLAYRYANALRNISRASALDARPAAITLPLFLHRILRGRASPLGVTMRARTASACRLTEQGVEALSWADRPCTHAATDASTRRVKRRRTKRRSDTSGSAEASTLRLETKSAWT